MKSIGRKVKTFAIFSPRSWVGLRPDNSAQAWLYYKLKNLGFRETIWQYVYCGQMGGLVLPLDDGAKELHVRFYCDTVEAEVEIGRHHATHFTCRRYQGEAQVLNLLKAYSSECELNLAQSIMRPDTHGVADVFIQPGSHLRFRSIALYSALALTGTVALGILPKDAIGLLWLTFGALVFSLPKAGNRRMHKFYLGRRGEYQCNPSGERRG